MKSADLLNFTSTLILMIWISLQWRATKNSGERLAAAALAIVIPAGFLLAGHFRVFSNFESFPPPFALLPIMILGLSVFLAFSKFGDNILKQSTLSGLVAFHSFRVLAEGVIVLGVHEGIAPAALSFEGYQFDIVTGITAVFAAMYLRKNPSPKLALLFNFMGLAFLTIILFIAFASMPTPLRLFMSEPSNIWVTGGPYILLPGILVTAAFTGHWLIFRKIRVSA